MAANVSVKESPSPRSWPFIASNRDVVYLWGGRGDTEPEVIHLYEINSETWTKKLTKGPYPIAGLCGGACALAGRSLFLYGGLHDSSSLSGTFYELNMADWTWKILSEYAAGGPQKKFGCRMIAYKGQLLLLGGFCGWIEEHRQPGSRYEDFSTNELHCYGLTSGKEISLCDLEHKLQCKHIDYQPLLF